MGKQSALPLLATSTPTFGGTCNQANSYGQSLSEHWTNEVHAEQVVPGGTGCGEHVSVGKQPGCGGLAGGRAQCRAFSVEESTQGSEERPRHSADLTVSAL